MTFRPTIIALCAVALLCSAAQGGVFGDQNIGPNPLSIENQPRGKGCGPDWQMHPTATCTADSITAYFDWDLSGSLSAGNVHMALYRYDSTGATGKRWHTFIDSTANFDLAGLSTGTQWIGMPLLNAPTLNTTAHYVPEVSARNNVSYLIRIRSTGAGVANDTTWTKSATYGAWPVPYDSNMTYGANSSYSIYVTYTVPSTLKPRRRRMLLEQTGWRDLEQRWLWPHCQGTFAGMRDKIED